MEPKKTIEKITSHLRNPANAAFLESLEQSEKLDSIHSSNKEIVDAVKSIPTPELKIPDEQKIEIVGAELVKIKGRQGDKGETGANGYTPVKGQDYFTPEEQEEFLKKATPVKDVHYRDGIDGRDGADGQDGKNADETKIIKEVLKKIPKPKDGRDGETPKTEDIIKATLKHLSSLKGKERPSLRMFRESDDLIGKVALHSDMMSRMPKSLLDGDQRWGGHGWMPTDEQPITGATISGNTYTFLHPIGIITLDGQKLSTLNGDYTQSGNYTITLTNTPVDNPPLNTYGG